MKFIFATVFCLCVFFCFEALAETAYDRIIQKGEMRCGYGVYSPFIEKNLTTGEIKGVMPDLARAMADRLGFKLVWGEETGWGNLPTSLKNGRVDVACSTLWSDPKRGKLVAFTEPVFYQPLYAYVKEGDSRFVDGLKALNSEDVTFAMIDGGYSLSLVERLFPKAKRNSLPQISTWSEVVLNVTNGKADVIISDPTFIGGFNKNNEIKLVPVSEEPVVVFGNSFAVGIQEHELKEMINNTVRYMIMTGEIEEVTKDFRETYPGVMILPQKPFE